MELEPDYGRGRATYKETGIGSRGHRLKDAPGICMDQPAVGVERAGSGRSVLGAGPRMELLLLQVMEENRLLRMRLEQTDTMSSWPSSRPRAALPDTSAAPSLNELAVQSPMSFAPMRATRRGDVHSFEGVGTKHLPGFEAMRMVEVQAKASPSRVGVGQVVR